VFLSGLRCRSWLGGRAFFDESFVNKFVEIWVQSFVVDSRHIVFSVELQYEHPPVLANTTEYYLDRVKFKTV